MGSLISRAVLVVVTMFVAVVYYGSAGHVDFVESWGEGTFGLNMPPFDTLVATVAPGSPAQRAGVRVGDRIRLANGYQPTASARGPFAGETRALTFTHDGVPYTVEMTAVPVPGFGFWQRAGGILALLPATIFLVVAFILAFARPSVMAWSFYIFAVGFFGTGPVFQFWSHVLDQKTFLVLTFAMSTIFGSWSVLPLLAFVLRFPDDSLKGWRCKIDGLVWIFLGVTYAAFVAEWWIYVSTGTYPGWSGLIETDAPLAAFVFAALVLIKNYAVADPAERHRWSFVVIGLVASFVAYAIYFVPGIPFAVGQVVEFAVVLMPICVAYASCQLRVIDISFVLNRSLVYGILSVGVIAFVSVLDWLLSRVVANERLTVGIELLVTIGVGFLLDRINRLVGHFVETIFFRGRRIAESYLRRAGQALPYATEESAISEGLVQVPVDALRLAAAALYRRSNDGKRFEGVATSANTTVAPPGFDANHLLPRMLLSGERSVWLDELRSSLEAENAAIYVLAVPVAVRHQLVSFTLYGAHDSGAQLDPDEVELLEGLAREAARAYDHVEAVRVRERYARFIEANPETA